MSRDDEGELWRALVEGSPDITIVTDVEGTVQLYSPIPAGAPAETFIGRPVWALGDYPRDAVRAAAVKERIAEVVARRRALVFEHPGIRKDSTGGWTRGWYEVRAAPIKTDGEMRRILWVLRDITEQKATIERLEFQATMLDQVNQAVLATDGQGVILSWNEAAQRMFGFTAEEAVGRVATELLRTQWAPSSYEQVSRAIAEKSSWAGETSILTKDGSQAVVEASLRRVDDETGAPRHYIVSLRDATKRRLLEEQLRQSQKMEAIGLLAGGVAHDFNNLLAVILGFSELAARKLPPGHPVAAQLGEVFEAARRGGELTRKLLAFSRKQIIQARPLDVRTAVDDFTRMIRRIVGEDVQLVVESTPGPLVIRADGVQLEQVLLNLCTNARQAMPSGGTLSLVTRGVQFDEVFVQRHPWASAGSFAEIAVRDTGIGMDETTRARAFEPFFTTKRDGTGLGLASVYGIIQQHGGFLHVDSAPGEGTTVHVYLPVTTDPEGAAAVSIHGVDTPKAIAGGEVVLVAEDEPSLRVLVTTTLTDLGYSVITARDGAEAIQLFSQRANEVSLVLLDVVMPGLDARQAYDGLRAVRPDVKVLFTTGYAPASTRLAELLQSGELPILEKPFTPQALAVRVRKTIDAR